MKLPREADDLRGLPAWFDEAVERILKMGEGTVTQHPLDSCLFMAFDRPIQSLLDDDGEAAEAPRLLAIFGLHVDDPWAAATSETQPRKASWTS